jgi:hypothetical protein
MHDGKPSTPRDWKVVAQELTRETDSNRMLELSRELIEALDGPRLDLLGRPKKPQADSAALADPKSGVA